MKNESSKNTMKATFQSLGNISRVEVPVELYDKVLSKIDQLNSKKITTQQWIRIAAIFALLVTVNLFAVYSYNPEVSSSELSSFGFSESNHFYHD